MSLACTLLWPSTRLGRAQTPLQGGDLQGPRKAQDLPPWRHSSRPEPAWRPDADPQQLLGTFWKSTVSRDSIITQLILVPTYQRDLADCKAPM